jgi:flagellar biogenesis protein FliO
MPWTASGAAVSSSDAVVSFGHMMTRADAGLFRVSIALIFCLALGIAVILVLRRFGTLRPTLATGAQRRLKIVETTRLGPKATLHLIECDGSSVLVACDEGGIKMLHTTPTSSPQEHTA